MTLERSGPPAGASEVVQARSVLSPLRYPGGKRRLVPYIAAALEANALKPDLFIEPFAGGASVSLELLATGRVRRVALVERDPYLASFWQTVFFDSDWLCQRIAEIDVSVNMWERMRAAKSRARRNQALACLFLNRTSFNGTLHRRAGAIGGRAQAGLYTIDCRFPRERLIRRIRACAELAGRVAFVRHGSAFEALADVPRERADESVFFYLDPPFWAKSERLYRCCFSAGDHARLADVLRDLAEPYLLSYDPAPQVRALYETHPGATLGRVELLYTATQRAAEEELVITNLQEMPGDTRLWRTHSEWARLRRRRCSPPASELEFSVPSMNADEVIATNATIQVAT